jgi:PAS domain S-box-containing protein
MGEESETAKKLQKEELRGKLKKEFSGIFMVSQTMDQLKTIDSSDLEGNEEKTKKDFELENIEENYRTIFENYAIAITLADEKERIILWNKYAEELLNLNEKDLFLKPVHTLYPLEEWKKIRSENVRRKGIKYRMETRMIKKDHGFFDVELSLCTLKGVGGNVVGSIGIIKDITELKRIEKKLIESEHRYRTIFENSAIAITLTDENERIISWNAYAEKLLDMNKDDLYLKPVRSLYPPEEWKKIRSENIRQKGMQHCLETKMIRKNNEQIYVDISLSILKNAEGKITGSIGVIKDITSRKKMEDELKNEHDLLQSLLDNIPDSIYFKDENNRFIKVNKAKAMHSNVTIHEMIGKNDFDLYPMEEAKKMLIDEIKVMEYKEIIRNEEQITRQNGEKAWVSVVKTPRYDTAGNVIGILGISRDITDRKKMEEELKETHQNLSQINKNLEKIVQERTADIEKLLKQKDEFITQLGHDLKTPLTPLCALLPVVRAKTTDEEMQKYLDLLIRNTEYMKNLVQKTMKLAFLNSTSFQLESQKSDVWNVVERIIKNQSTVIQNKGLEVHNYIDKNLILTVDILRFEELFANLLSNAIKYSFEKGFIEISAEEKQDVIEFSIKDTGLGLTNEQATRIFDEFYKVDASRRDLYSDGLGLSICKRIVEKHGGKIWAESPGLQKGSTFYFTIPLQ